MTKVSIIIPTYNRANFLQRSINSAFAQTFQDFELIVVDDCSIDNTKEIIENIKKSFPNIQYIFLEQNGGAANAINVGVKHSKGEFIAILDSDDEWMPTKLEKQLNAHKQSKSKKIGLVGCGALLYNEKGQFLGPFNVRLNELGLPYLLRKNYITQHTLLPKKVLDEVGPRDTKLKVIYDWEMWIRIADKGYDFEFVSEPLFKYFIQQHGLVRSASMSKLIDEFLYLTNKFSSLYNKHKKYYSGLLHDIAIAYFLNRRYKDAFVYYWKATKKFPFQLETITNLVPFLVGRKLYTYIYHLKLLWNKDYLSM